MFFQFRLAYVAPESLVVGAGELVDHPKKIARNYLHGYFFLDFFIVLPLPQVTLFLLLQTYAWNIFSFCFLQLCFIFMLNMQAINASSPFYSQLTINVEFIILSMWWWILRLFSDHYFISYTTAFGIIWSKLCKKSLTRCHSCSVHPEVVSVSSFAGRSVSNRLHIWVRMGELYN